jgi:hypothetical protein
MPKILKTWWEFAVHHHEKAIKHREDFYRGVANAQASKGRGRYRTAKDDESAEYMFQNSLEGSSLISNNNWQMNQSRMFAALEQAQQLDKLNRTMQEVLTELRHMRREANERGGK